jgi:hypothetical protein
MSPRLTPYKANLKTNKVKFQIIKIIKDEIEKNTIKKDLKQKK